MACPSLTALPRECGAAGVLGGLDLVYAMAWNDAQNIGVTDLIYAVTPTGTVSDIGVKTGKNFVKIDQLPGVAGMNEVLTADRTKGQAYFTQTVTLVNADLSTANRKWITDTMTQPIIVIGRTRNKKYFVAGLDGQLLMNTADGGTGIADADLNGHTITYTGTEAEPMRLVDSAIIADLLIPAP